MPEEENTDPGGQPLARRPQVDYLILLGILALWIVLQIWVLPKAGVPT